MSSVFSRGKIMEKIKYKSQQFQKCIFAKTYSTLNLISICSINWKRLLSIDKINVSCPYNTETYFEFYLHLVDVMYQTQDPF